MLRIAIVGCGKIADAHASQIQRIVGCEIVGACDREPLMARQLAERFSIPHACGDLSWLLEEVRPDVVHITTSPQSHFAIGKECLENGAHVYIEKPFTIHGAEAEELVAIAERVGRLVTVGHDDQFRHAARRMRELVRGGYLGGPPVHMDSFYCYELGDSGYARALLRNKNHWIRRLPGGLLQNIISHGIARISEFFTTESPRVVAHGFVSPMLRQMGETELIDELRVIVSEDQRMTAYFTFSSQMQPSLHQFRIYGPRNGLLLDQDNETLIRLRGSRYKSFLEQFVPPVGFAAQHLGNLGRNLRTFLANDFHPKAGMKFLIESFYRSIAGEEPVPIPYPEILRTSRIMDQIFAQISMEPAGAAPDRAAVCVQP